VAVVKELWTATAAEADDDAHCLLLLAVLLLLPLTDETIVMGMNNK